MFLIKDIKLQNFRSYSFKELKTDHPVICIVGANGSGKTNILEAISLIADKKGIRGVAIEDCIKKDSKDKTIISSTISYQRLYELTKNQDTFITTEVGQHQMWAAQYYKFQRPKRWMTSGGLGTMGFGLPAAIGVQLANPGKLVVDIAGEASILMNIQELSTAVQYRLPVKIFIINNQYMGMVRQWQELLHEKNYSESYSEALPDFVKLAEAYGAVGIRAQTPSELDSKIKQMLSSDRPVLFDCRVEKIENCFPMIPSGKAHNEMILGAKDEEDTKISKQGKVLV